MDPARKTAFLAGSGKGDIPDDDEDMGDAALLAEFDWQPASLEDIDAMPERVLWLYVSYRNGQQARINAESRKNA